MESRVDCNQRFDGWSPQAQSSKCEWKRCGAKPSDADNFSRGNLTVTHNQPGTAAGSRGRWHHHLNWIRRLEVEAEQPSCARANKYCLRWKHPPPGRKRQPGIFRQLGPAVKPKSDALPGLTRQRMPRESSVPRLVE